MKGKLLSGLAALLLLIFFVAPWFAAPSGAIAAEGAPVQAVSGAAISLDWATSADARLGLLATAGALALLLPATGVIAGLLALIAAVQPGLSATIGGVQMLLALLAAAALAWLAWQGRAAGLVGQPGLWGSAISTLLLLAGGALAWRGARHREETGSAATADAAHSQVQSPQVTELLARSAPPAAAEEAAAATPFSPAAPLDGPTGANAAAAPSLAALDPPARAPAATTKPLTPWEKLTAVLDGDPAELADPPLPEADLDAADLPSELAWLVIRTGGVASDQYRLRQSTTIGRHADNEIVLRDTAVSGHHARVLWEHDQFVLYDSGSTNGTYVYRPETDHWQPVERIPLTDGMQLKVGRIVFQFTTI